MFSTTEWVRKFQGKTSQQCALEVQRALLGYRQNALVRAEDADQLMYAMEAYAEVYLANLKKG